MIRLLRIAEFVYGAEARDRCFEPLIADWQREFDEAPTISARAGVAIRGGVACGVSLAVYGLTGGIVMPPRTWLKAATVLTVSTMLLVVLQIAFLSTQLTIDFPLEMRLWMALPLVLPYAIPIALLVLMMRLHAVAGVTASGAAGLIVAGVLATVVVTGWLTPLMQGDVRDELYEQMHQRAVANDRAGRFTYPGSARRAMRPNETPEQRAEGYRRFKSTPEYLAAQEARTRPRWDRDVYLAATVALAMGVLGWVIGGLRSISLPTAAAWWIGSYATLLVLDRRFHYPGGLIAASLGRLPFWLPLAVFGALATIALIGSARARATSH